jgi:hypothetical protein
MDPAELQSVKTFVAEQEQQNAEKEASHNQVTNKFFWSQTLKLPQKIFLTN